MSINESLNFKQVVRIIVCCIFAFAVAMFITAHLSSLTQKHSFPAVKIARTTEGFDFTPILRMNSGAGPKIEERINLEMLEGPDRVTLASVIGNRPSVIAVVDNECGMCTIAADQMQYVRNGVLQAGLQYFIVSFTSSGPPSRFFQYTDSLHIDAPAFLWRNDKSNPPESLFAMVVPSHLLIDRSGLVRKVWPGANDSKLIRDKMANQIVNDTLKILATGS